MIASVCEFLYVYMWVGMVGNECEWLSIRQLSNSINMGLIYYLESCSTTRKKEPFALHDP